MSIDQKTDDVLRHREIDSDTLADIGRAGWVAKGIVYVIIGALTVPIALSSGGSTGDEASRSGAIGKIAESPFGQVALFVIAIGLGLYSLWRLTTAVLPGDNDLETWGHRAGYLASGVMYGFLAHTALRGALAGGSGSSASGGGGNQVAKYTSDAFEMTGGRLLVGIAGIGAVVLGGMFIVRGVRQKFLERLDLGDATEAERQTMDKLGVIGWIGRGITSILIGVFLTQAAVDADPSDAKGLDGALRETADTWWGSALVLVAGAALIGYGIFAVVSARHRRLVGP